MQTLKKYLGGLMLMIVFGGIIVLGSNHIGLLKTLIVFGISLAVTSFIVIAVRLISGDL